MLFSSSSLTLVSKQTQTYRYISNAPFSIDSSIFEFLSECAFSNQSTQSRICFHQGDSSLFHSMLVYHHLNHIVPWHFHPTKNESIHLLSGEATVYYKAESDSLNHSILLNHDTPFVFFPQSSIHTLELHSDLYFIESTSGPFTSSSIIRLS